jgi:GGDEF domain-containing protein
VAVTVSVGVAAADSDAANDGAGPTSLERLLQRADSAMYRAKSGGKNRCDAA